MLAMQDVEAEEQCQSALFFAKSERIASNILLESDCMSIEKLGDMNGAPARATRQQQPIHDN